MAELADDCGECGRKHFKLRECFDYIDELMYRRYSKSDPIEKRFSSPKPGLVIAYVTVGQNTYEYSRQEHTNPEDALHELILLLEERHPKEKL